jgi:hypothetical protein
MSSLRHPRCALVVLGLCLAGVAAVPEARAQEDLFQNLTGRVNKPLLDTAGFFAVVIPSGFDCQAKARKVSCVGNRGVQAILTIDVVDVPPSASVELFVLNQIDAFKKKEHFKLLGQKALKIDGHKALLATYTFDHYGNVRLPGGAQGLYMVKNTKAYVIHYEGRADQFAVHQKDLEDLYASFKTARLDGGGNPIVEDLKPGAPKSQTGNADLDRALRGGF